MEVTYNKRVGWAWTFYDWANSSYNLVITATLFPIYYTIISTSDGSEQVDFLGMQFKNTVLYDYAIAFAYLLIALILPLLSGIADASGKKKRFMQFFTFVGAASCAMLSQFNESTFELGIFLVMLAVIGYAGSLVFYNAFLPEIAPPQMHDKLSARGFAMGYFGSSLLLIGSLIFILKPELLYDIEAVRAGFVSQYPNLATEDIDTKVAAWSMRHTGPWIFVAVGIWWLSFAMIPFYFLKNKTAHAKSTNSLLSGYREINTVWKQVKQDKMLKRFLGGFFFYNMATQTIMLVAVIFAKVEVGMDSGDLIITVLIIQFVGIIGAFLFSWASARTHNIFTLRLAVMLWIGVCISAYFIQDSTAFYVLAAFVGLLMGGSQALSRSTYSKIIPKTTDTASFFSFYDVTEKLGIVLGLVIFGFIDDVTGSMRNATVALSVLYAIGLVWLFLVPKREGVSAKVAR